MAVELRADDCVESAEFRAVARFATLGVDPTPLRGVQRFAKRVVDITGAAVVLVLVAPFLAALAVAIKLDSKGPAFFSQVRVGTHGRTFRLFKLRTMFANAEEHLEGLQGRNEAVTPLFKMNDDPRVTRLGGFLRRHSIDELPQVWNALRGEMSLVGPRPGLPSEVEQWTPDAYHRLRVKPGITGMWQIRDRECHSFDEYVQLDRTYIDNWSLWLDLRIMARTIPNVVSPRTIR